MNTIFRCGLPVFLLGILSFGTGVWWSASASRSVFIYQAAMLTGLLGVLTFLVWTWWAARLVCGARCAALSVAGFLLAVGGPCIAYRVAWSDFTSSQITSPDSKRLHAVAVDVPIIVALAKQYRSTTGKWPVTGPNSADLLVHDQHHPQVMIEIAKVLAIDGHVQSLFIGPHRSPLQGNAIFFLDPWGIPYYMVFDLDNDGFCTIGDGIRIECRDGLFVWSMGLWQTIAQTP